MCKAYHSLLSRTEVENEWSYTSNTAVCLHGVDRPTVSLLNTCKSVCAVRCHLSQLTAVILLEINCLLPISIIPSVHQDITFQHWCNRFCEASFSPVQCFFTCPLLCIMSQTYSTNLYKPNTKSGNCIEVMYIQEYELFQFFKEIC